MVLNYNRDVYFFQFGFAQSSFCVWIIYVVHMIHWQNSRSLLFRFKQVKHLESKVLAPLGDYGHQCKVAKVRIFASNNYDLLVMT